MRLALCFAGRGGPFLHVSGGIRPWGAYGSTKCCSFHALGDVAYVKMLFGEEMRSMARTLRPRVAYLRNSDSRAWDGRRRANEPHFPSSCHPI